MRRQLSVVVLLFLLLPGCCCPAVNAAREAAKRAQSSNNMMQMAIAAITYQDMHGAWPETLDDLRGQLPMLDELLINPLTNDVPGYEYVKPVDENSAMSETVILYQLRNGTRDTSLPMGYADGSVR